MFSVIFEVQPKADCRDAYLAHAARLRPELVKIDGFVGNVRYSSLTRPDTILSLSDWRDEKAVIRWRTHAEHHGVQEQARSVVLADYRLRVGQVTQDTDLPKEHVIAPQRLDEMETGGGTTLTLIEARRPIDWPETKNLYDCAEWIGFNPYCGGCKGWDLVASMSDPASMILLTTWLDETSAKDFEDVLNLRDGARFRRIRVVRDYGMFDRREAPQYFSDVQRPGDRIANTHAT